MNTQTSTGLNISEKMKIAENYYSVLDKTGIDKASYVHGIFDALFHNEGQISMLKEKIEILTKALNEANGVVEEAPNLNRYL